MLRISLIFGIVTVFAGIFGVAIGAESARRLRVRFRNADPLVCAAGLIACAPFVFSGMVVAYYNNAATWVRQAPRRCKIIEVKLVIIPFSVCSFSFRF